jgi:FkbM family methyltransferase
MTASRANLGEEATATAAVSKQGSIAGKKLRTLGRLLLAGNLRELRRAVYDNAVIFARVHLAGARRRGYVRIDGCRFSLQGIDPASSMYSVLMLGCYELPERRAIAKYLDPAWPVIELGGCAGVVACITNRRLQQPQAHVVVEANPAMMPLLERNQKMNGCGFRVVNAAIAYDGATTTYSPSADAMSNRLNSGLAGAPAITVPNRSLASLAAESGFNGFTLICDIEGHEYELLRQEPEAVAQARLLILETHERYIGPEKHQFVLRQLAELGFQIAEQIETVLAMVRQ